MRKISNNRNFIFLAVVAATFAAIFMLPETISYMGVLVVSGLALMWDVKVHCGEDSYKKGIVSLQATIPGILMGIVFANVITPVMAAGPSVAAAAARNPEQDIIFTLINAAVVMAFSACGPSFASSTGPGCSFTTSP